MISLMANLKLLTILVFILLLMKESLRSNNLRNQILYVCEWVYLNKLDGVGQLLHILWTLLEVLLLQQLL